MKYFFMRYYFHFSKNYPKKDPGFTLLEMIVVVAIFSIMVVVISSILNSVFLSKKVMVAREKLQSDSNSVIEIISKDVRSSKPDYLLYGSANLSDFQTVLYLVDKDDNRIAYQKFSSPQCGSDSEGNPLPDCLKIIINNQETNITPKGVELIDVRFYIEPVSDPFALDPESRLDKQPLITIVLKTKAEVSKNQGAVYNIVQTSVSSRVYQARSF